MRGTRRGIPLLAWLAGLGLSLGGALFAQDSPTKGTASKASKAKGGTDKDSSKKGDASPSATDDEPSAGEMPKAKGKRGSAKAKKGETPKKADAASPPPETATAEDDKAIKFSRDVAPILVGNCIGCHNPRSKARNGGFDLTTFQGLMAGGKSGKVIVPGKPEESHLVELVATKEMPRGNRGKLSEEAVGRIEQWVKAGATLDAKGDPSAPLEKIAETPEQLRQREVAKLSPEDRDKKLQEVALDRWKKAGAKGTPVATIGKNFLLFGNLPKPRAERLLKAMEGQRTALGALLGRDGSKGLTGPEKVSLYVFNDSASYVEFVRSVEKREVESGVEAHGRLNVGQPYVAAVDPLNGAEEPTGPAKKSAKSKKSQADDAPDGPDRTLAGLLSEGLAASATTAAGKPPRWLTYGLGAYLAAQVEPRGSPYFAKLRREASQQFSLGWETKANQAVGGEGDPATIRAIGFSMCEWLSTAFRPQFPDFVQGMLMGGDKLDEAIRFCFGDQVGRVQFYQQWGEFLVARYGAGRRR